MSNCQWAVVCMLDETVSGPFSSPESADKFISEEVELTDLSRGDYRIMPFYQVDEEDEEEGEDDED